MSFAFWCLIFVPDLASACPRRAHLVPTRAQNLMSFRRLPLVSARLTALRAMLKRCEAVQLFPSAKTSAFGNRPNIRRNESRHC